LAQPAEHNKNVVKYRRLLAACRRSTATAACAAQAKKKQPSSTEAKPMTDDLKTKKALIWRQPGRSRSNNGRLRRSTSSAAALAEHGEAGKMGQNTSRTC